MSVLEANKKPEPKPVEPVVENEVTNEDINMIHKACCTFHKLLSDIGIMINLNCLC